MSRIEMLNDDPRHPGTGRNSAEQLTDLPRALQRKRRDRPRETSSDYPDF